MLNDPTGNPFPPPDPPQPCVEDQPLEQPTDAQLDEIEDEPAE